MHIVLIGCGKMGSALLSGWIEKFPEARFTVIEPAGLPKQFQGNGAVSHQTKIIFENTPDVLLLAVKPQILADVLSNLQNHIPSQTLIVSIAAGKTLSFFQDAFGTEQPIVRAMPNTPAAIGKGITTGVAGAAVSNAHKTLSQQLFDASGEFFWIEEEAHMDAVTAISGSGPAYIFYLIEVLEQSAIKLGLSQDVARALARQTVIGGGALADREATIPVSTLRENVTSPGGTTAAALDILMNGQWQDLFERATKAARDRSQELSA